MNMDRNDMISALEAFFRDMDREYRVDMASLYGSWACGCPRQDSDVDVAVLFSSELISDNEAFEVIGDISLNLSERLHKEVNVLQLERIFKKPMLYYNAIVLGIPVYVRSMSDFLDLRWMAIAQMEDFSLFGQKWQLFAAKRNLEVLTHA